MQVYLPDDLYRQVKENDLPASELLQEAVKAETRRREKIAYIDEYLAELIAEIGEPSPEAMAEAEAMADRISAHLSKSKSKSKSR